MAARAPPVATERLDGLDRGRRDSDRHEPLAGGGRPLAKTRDRLPRRHARSQLRRRSGCAAKPPTPTGRFFVVERVRQARRSALGPWVLATSAYSNVLQEFEGGPGQIRAPRPHRVARAARERGAVARLRAVLGPRDRVARTARAARDAGGHTALTGRLPGTLPGWMTASDAVRWLWAGRRERSAPRSAGCRRQTRRSGVASVCRSTS